jgi:hypothetical protein
MRAAENHCVGMQFTLFPNRYDLGPESNHFHSLLIDTKPGDQADAVTLYAKFSNDNNEVRK